MGSPDRRGGRGEGGREARGKPRGGSARCALHVEGGGGGTGALRVRTAAPRGRCLIPGASLPEPTQAGAEVADSRSGEQALGTLLLPVLVLLCDGMSSETAS